MKKQYQITLICKSGQYKPVSCIISHESVNIATDKIGKKSIQLEGIKKICQKRYWTSRDLAKYQYTTVKIREYDPVKIKAENEKRYAEIKEAKYLSGEWKRPGARN